MAWIDYGLGGLRAAALDCVSEATADLADLYTTLASRDQLFGFTAHNRFYEIGTPRALAETEAFLSSPAERA